MTSETRSLASAGAWVHRGYHERTEQLLHCLPRERERVALCGEGSAVADANWINPLPDRPRVYCATCYRVATVGASPRLSVRYFSRDW